MSTLAMFDVPAPAPGVVPRTGVDAAGPGLTPAEMAVSFDEVVTVSQWFEHELSQILAAEVPLCQATVDRLGRLLDRMRSAAKARERLAGAEPAVLLGGVAAWLAERQDAGADPLGARARACRAWVVG